MKVNISKLNWVVVCFMFSYIPNGNAGPSGEDLYLQNCIACHAYDGSGSMPGVADFKESLAWKNMDDLALLYLLKRGVEKKGSTINMPPKGGNPNLTDDELNKIIRYMHKTFNK
jgi:mono/diheme cytochrome c family protein